MRRPPLEDLGGGTWQYDPEVDDWHEEWCGEETGAAQDLSPHWQVYHKWSGRDPGRMY